SEGGSIGGISASGAGGSQPIVPSPPGNCAAVCVSSVHLVVGGLQSGELFSGSFEACRNDECYRSAAFEAGEGGNVKNLAESFADPSVRLAYYEEGASFDLDLEWSWWAPPRLTDGDRYTLRWIEPAGIATTLIDTPVSYEPRTLCGSSCLTAYLPNLERPIEAVGGAGAD
ncbi:MAG TPA: hypothetical protein VIW29_02855, partial [Polyangiaceae bacterium]